MKSRVLIFYEWPINCAWHAPLPHPILYAGGAFSHGLRGPDGPTYAFQPKQLSLPALLTCQKMITLAIMETLAY